MNRDHSHTYRHRTMELSCSCGRQLDLKRTGVLPDYLYHAECPNCQREFAKALTPEGAYRNAKGELERSSEDPDH